MCSEEPIILGVKGLNFFALSTLLDIKDLSVWNFITLLLQNHIASSFFSKILASGKALGRLSLASSSESRLPVSNHSNL